MGFLRRIFAGVSAGGSEGASAGAAPETLYARVAVSPATAGAHLPGATTVTLDSVTGIVPGMRLYAWHGAQSWSLSDVTAVDEDASQLTIAPGLAAAVGDGVTVTVAPMADIDDTLALGGGALAHLDVTAIFNVWNADSGQFRDLGGGLAVGDWYAGGNITRRTEFNFGGWAYDYAFGVAGEVAVAILKTSFRASESTSFSLAFDPDANALAIRAAGTAGTVLPALSMLRVTGQRA